MIIQIIPTDNLTEIETVPVRLWDGITVSGMQCKVFVHRGGVHKDEDCLPFEDELMEFLPSGRKVDLRHIL